MQYPATNRPAVWSEIHIYRFNAEGRITEHWVELSMLELMLQIDAARMN